MWVSSFFSFFFCFHHYYYSLWNANFIYYILVLSIVEFSRPEYAERAMRVLNRVEFMGRPVFVREVIIVI